jgi:hypothetical protein
MTASSFAESACSERACAEKADTKNAGIENAHGHSPFRIDSANPDCAGKKAPTLLPVRFFHPLAAGY